MNRSRRSVLAFASAVSVAGLVGRIDNAMSRFDRSTLDTESATPPASPEATPGVTPMDIPAITITFGDAVVHGELWDNPTSRDLVSLLPLELVFSDYNSVEKTASLPRALTMDGVPAGADPEPSAIGYYAPGNVLVLYYGDVGYWNGIVRLGRMLDNGEAIVAQTSDFTARIEIATDEVKSEATP